MTDLEAQQPSSSSLLYLLTGCHIIKPEVITKLEQGEEPWVVEGEFLLQSHSGVCGEGVAVRRVITQECFSLEVFNGAKPEK